MSGFEVEGPKLDDSDSLGLKNGLYPRRNQQGSASQPSTEIECQQQ